MDFVKFLAGVSQEPSDCCDASSHLRASRKTDEFDFDQSPGNSVGDSPELVYNSATVGPKPVIQFELQSGR